MSTRQKWTIEKIMDVAANYETRSSWRKGHATTYNKAAMLGILEECCIHMTRKWGEWKYSKEQLHYHASQYDTLGDWCRHGNATYVFAKYKDKRNPGLMD